MKLQNGYVDKRLKYQCRVNTPFRLVTFNGGTLHQTSAWLFFVPPPGVACFLWFVGFCFLANQWQATSAEELPLAQGSDAARATIAFCFFSILTWVCISVYVCMRYAHLSSICTLMCVCVCVCPSSCLCVFQGYQSLLTMQTLKSVSFLEDTQGLLSRSPSTVSPAWHTLTTNDNQLYLMYKWEFQDFCPLKIS